MALTLPVGENVLRVRQLPDSEFSIYTHYEVRLRPVDHYLVPLIAYLAHRLVEFIGSARR